VSASEACAVLRSRSEERAAKAMAELRAEVPDAKVEFLQARAAAQTQHRRSAARGHATATATRWPR
jgi:hypothetical protein